MGRKKSTRKKKGGALSGMAQAGKNDYVETGKEGFLTLLAAIAASGAGAAIGKHSLVAGIPIMFFGIHKKNAYIIAAGLGLTLSNGFQNPAQAKPATTTEGMDGLKEIAEQAKNRVGTFFQNFKEKLYLGPAAPATTDGLGEDEVTYFVNPYKSTGEIDMSAIDRVQEQIAEMTRNGNNLSEVDREF
ncbi:MAG: hypothetical protein WEB30_07080 [Cyclobacteriaceae bacterium]